MPECTAFVSWSVYKKILHWLYSKLCGSSYTEDEYKTCKRCYDRIMIVKGRSFFRILHFHLNIIFTLISNNV